jgi:calcineurin-like phosphoesterase family protein
MNVFFTSDPHIGHRLVARHRYDVVHPHGLALDDEVLDWHDDILAQNWDVTVKPDDIVWVLGDVSLGGRAREKAALEWIAARPGEKHLIAGNHDSAHPMHREAHKDQKRYLEVFDSVQSAARRRFSLPTGKLDVMLSHFPYYADHGDGPARYMEWRLRDEGFYLMHGHTHSRQQFNGREIHVGLDAWDLTPVSLGVIQEYLTQREESQCSSLNVVSAP